MIYRPLRKIAYYNYVRDILIMVYVGEIALIVSECETSGPVILFGHFECVFLKLPFEYWRRLVWVWSIYRRDLVGFLYVRDSSSTRRIKMDFMVKEIIQVNEFPFFILGFSWWCVNEKCRQLTGCSSLVLVLDLIGHGFIVNGLQEAGCSLWKWLMRYTHVSFT